MPTSGSQRPPDGGVRILRSVCLSVSLPDTVYSLCWEISFRGMAANRLKPEAERGERGGETGTDSERS